MATLTQSSTRKNAGKLVLKKRRAKVEEKKRRRRKQKRHANLFEQAALIPKVVVTMHPGNEAILAHSINLFTSAERTDG